LDVAPALLRALAQHHLSAQSALAPVDVAGVVAVAHGANADDLVSATATEEVVAPLVPAGVVGWQAHRVHRGIDDELAVGGKLSGLFEQPEREARGHAE